MTALFRPFDLNGITLNNRIVMAPMTRSRAPDDAADAMTALYYTQRATAGLIVSEGTPISREGQCYLFNPGIFSAAQVDGWRLVTDSVHAVGGRIFAQLWHVGRVSHTSIQPDGRAPVSASSRRAEGAVAYGLDAAGQPGFVATSTPRMLATDEVRRIVDDFALAADNAVRAGFDGVEIHAANGYLFEQFFNPLVNDRSDAYSNTLENRIRFAVEVIDAIVARIGAGRVGIRISPYGELFDMPPYPDTLETYRALAAQIGRRNIAYVHVMDQSNYAMASGDDQAGAQQDASRRTTELLRTLKAEIGSAALILAGGLTLARATELVESGLIDLAAFGQPFIANPDLVRRLEQNLPLAEPQRATYYGGGAEGYIDYPPCQDRQGGGG